MRAGGRRPERSNPYVKPFIRYRECGAAGIILDDLDTPSASRSKSDRVKFSRQAFAHRRRSDRAGCDNKMPKSALIVFKIFSEGTSESSRPPPKKVFVIF